MGEQIIDNFSPDYVIPFKVPKNQVMDTFQKFSKKPLTPKDFNCDRVVDKMQGVYIPFWLYSGNCEGSITAEGINTRTWTSGNYRYTEKSIIQFTETEISISKLFLWMLLQRLTMTLWTLSSLLITRK